MKTFKNKIILIIFLTAFFIAPFYRSSLINYEGSYSQDDSYFKGHFVDFPIMPGVLVVEGIAQTGTILLRKKIGSNHKQKHLLAYQVKNAKFYSLIFPGDKIKYQVQFLGLFDNKIANFTGQALVGGKKKCEVEFTIAIVDKDQLFPRP